MLAQILMIRWWRRPALAGALGLFALLSSSWACAKSCPPALELPTTEQLTEAARHAVDRGFLWTIEKNGQTSHLYGTLHLGKLPWALPGPRLTQALRASKALAMELDVSDPQTVQQLLTQIQAPGPSPLTPALQAQLREAAEALCVQWDDLAGQRPEFQLTALMVALARYENLDARFGSEASLAGMAQHLGLPTHGLETVQEQINALTVDNPVDLAAYIASGLRDLRSDKARRLVRRLADTWAQSDLKRLQDYNEWCECMDTAVERALAERLVDRRNGVLAGRIDALHAKEGPVLVAIGALHMTGANGLPELLKARGFTVKQVF